MEIVSSTNKRDWKNHPFAFITLSGETIGLPLSISAYYQNHANAVKKIGLTSAKNNGTSPHGHRHAYTKDSKMPI